MKAKLFPELKGSDKVTEDCGRCGGSGDIGYGNVTGAHYKYGALARSCFDCAGRGTVQVLVSSVRARESRRAKLEAKRAAEEAAWAAGAAQREAEEAAAAEAALVLAEAEAAAHAALPGVPQGRVQVTGEVLSIKWVENRFSYSGGGTLKMLVRSEAGWKVWGTCPGSLEAERGDTVTFTATVEPSSDDHAFGWFKRPVKASVLAKAEAVSA